MVPPLNKTPYDRVKIARHSGRPKGLDLVKYLFSSFEVLHGDRRCGEDQAMITGIGIIGDQRVIFVCQHKGSTADERRRHNFGMAKPEGFAKALRVMKLAEKFDLPVLTIVDTPGAYPGLDAEKRGQAFAIANNLFEMSCLKAPILSIILGEGSSGGALGISLADYIIMLEHAYFSVISPEGCASILWKDPAKKFEAAKQLCMQSENLLSYKMIDEVIEEGEGFHLKREEVMAKIRERVLVAFEKLRKESVERRLEKRYKKYRSF